VEEKESGVGSRNDYIRRIEKIETVLEAVLPRTSNTIWLKKTFSDIAVSLDTADNLIRPCVDLVQRGGKRWRPLLMTLVCEALGGKEKDALALSPLVELPHNASLIHDDIEDRSDTRRGEPAVHIRYGEDMGINSGSFLYFLPLICIDEWDAPIALKNKAYALWGECLRRLHLGQAMDITWHRSFDITPSVKDYKTMCGLKTGSLARLAAMVGVLAARRFSSLEEEGAAIAGALGDAAERLGVGFQILDDVKNLTVGNPGKKRGDDLVEGKKSLPILLYIHSLREKNDESTMSEIACCFAEARAKGVTAPAVETLIQKLEKSGVIAQAEQQGRLLIESAKTVFNQETYAGFPVAEESRALLTGLVDLIG
jgi:octaprenyl-diphosphate synthase